MIKIITPRFQETKKFTPTIYTSIGGQNNITVRHMDKSNDIKS